MRSYIRGLRCLECDPDHVNTDMTPDPLCPLHGKVEEAAYDLQAARREVDRDRLGSLRRDMWQWRSLLPVRDEANIVSLGEGGTPLFHMEQLGGELGLPQFHIKDESRNPTGSFKDRGASVTVSKCREVKVKGLILASSGNAASSFSAYCARADIPFIGFLRDETSCVHYLQAMICGNEIYTVAGDMVDGTRLAQEAAEKYGLFHCAQPYNLYRIEGKKTIAFEISQALNWRIPDRILVPTAGGTNVLALYKGYKELNALGWVSGMPAIDVVQSTECGPIIRAWESGEPVERWAEPRTKSIGLAHPFPRAGDEVVRIMKETGGVGWLVSDEQTFAASRTLARSEGIFLQPSSASPVAALAALGSAAAGKRFRDQVIVGIGTGSGKNQVEEPLAALTPAPRIERSLAALEEIRARCA